MPKILFFDRSMDFAMTFHTLLRNCATCLLATAALFGTANAYTVYKSTGEHGEVRYTQIPPKEGTYETLEFKTDGRVATQGEQAPDQADPNQIAEQNRNAELEQQLQEIQARENAQRCQALRNNLANLNMGGRLYETDANGNRNFLSNDQIAERKTRAEQAIAQFCQ